MALAVLPRREARRLAEAKPSPQMHDVPMVRDQIRTETRYAEFRQQLV
jgi:hypothetical protein